MLFITSGACRESAVPDFKIARNNPNLYIVEGRWYYGGRPFNGHIHEDQSSNLVLSDMPVKDGLPHGTFVGFYDNGQKMIENTFVHGILDGQSNRWWRNGKYRYTLFYRNNQLDGTQRAYFICGKIREEANYLNGALEGIQRVWDENGQLISNYTIKDKRIYGIVKVQSCIPGAEH